MAYAWVDGQVVREDEARVSVQDRAFLHGEGCFDTVRIHGAAPFRFDAHLRRLKESLDILGIRPPRAFGRVRDGAKEVVQTNRLREGLVRITVTPGSRSPNRAGTVAITARRLPAIPPRVVLRVAESVVRVPGPLSRCKTTSRAAEALALREAREAGAFDAILRNPRGNVVETTARNLFAVTGERIVTPPASEGALEGITRDLVLSVAKNFGLETREVPLAVDALLHGDEVFLTGSGVGVLGVHQIHARTYKPVPGLVTKRIAEAWEKALEREARW